MFLLDCKLFGVFEFLIKDGVGWKTRGSLTRGAPVGHQWGRGAPPVINGGGKTMRDIAGLWPPK